MHKLPKGMFVLSRTQGEYIFHKCLFLLFVCCCQHCRAVMGSSPNMARGHTCHRHANSALVQSWTPTVRTQRQEVGIKGEEKPKGGRKIHLQLACKEKKKPKNSQIGFGLNKKLHARCSELCHGAFSLLAPSPCSHDHMGLNPISHFVVRSLFFPPFSLSLLTILEKLFMKYISRLCDEKKKCEQV